jgi:hypothetical protein
MDVIRFHAPSYITPITIVALPRRTFKSYILHLPHWEQALLSNVELEVTEDMYFYDILNTTEATTILGVSDGGVKINYGYYGWVIATEQTVICQGRGTAFGIPTSSYRSEGYGRLAMMRFIYHYVKYFCPDITEPRTVHTYCDNTTVLNNEEKLQTGVWEWSSIWSAKPNYDILHELEQAHSELPCPVTTTHVKGHQDDKRTWNELSRPEQCNVLADGLATTQKDELLTQYPHGPPQGPFLPSHTVRLYHKDILITGKEKQMMMNQWQHDEISKYYKAKFKWSQDTLDRINWPAIKAIEKNLPDVKRRFIVKMFIRWLPLNKKEHEHGKGSSPNCIACGAEESQTHLYQCAQRTRWRLEFKKALRNTLTKLKTPVRMKRTILEGIQGELVNKPIHEREENDEFRQPDSLLTWRDFLRGRIDTNWATKMDTVYANQPDGRAGEQRSKTVRSGAQWTKTVIERIWDSMYELWKQRSTKQHSSDKSRRDDYLHQEAVATTRTFYEQKPKLRNFDQDWIFKKPFEETIELPTSQLQAWVSNTKKHIAAGLKEAQKEDLRDTRDLRDYWTSFRPP